MKCRGLLLFLALSFLTPWWITPGGAQDTLDESDRNQAENGAKEADKARVNNLPQNFKGVTGLMFTAATRVQNRGTVELGGATMLEQSADPKFTRTTYAFNATLGVARNLELGLHLPYVKSDLTYGEREDIFGNTIRAFSTGEQSGLGSVEGLLKWACYQPSLFLPSFSLGLGFIAPSADFEQHISQVKYFGLRTMAAMGVEINDLYFTDYSFAVMADGSLVFNDVGVKGRDYEEKHGEVHLGMIFPVLPQNYGTLIVEYEGILMRGTTNEGDENSVLFAGRLTTHHINFTAGAQIVFVEDRDMDDRTRLVANFSYKFGPPWPLFP